MNILYRTTAPLALLCLGGCASIQSQLCNLVDPDSYVVVSVVGCQTVELSVSVDADKDFSQLDTYAWLPVDRGQHKDVDPRVHDWITSTADTRLRRKGFTIDNKAPDFLVGYTTPPANMATLTLTVVAPDNGQPLWQGKAVDGAYPARNTVSWELRVRESVDKLLDKFLPAAAD